MRQAQFADLNTNRALTNKVAICGQPPVSAHLTGDCQKVTCSAAAFLPAINHNLGKVCLVDAETPSGRWRRRLLTFPYFIRARLDWSQARQRVLAENVANSDTPRFHARDLAPLRFNESPLVASGGLNPVSLARTESGHIKGVGLSQSPFWNGSSRNCRGGSADSAGAL